MYNEKGNADNLSGKSAYIDSNVNNKFVLDNNKAIYYSQEAQAIESYLMRYRDVTCAQVSQDLSIELEVVKIILTEWEKQGKVLLMMRRHYTISKDLLMERSL